MKTVVIGGGASGLAAAVMAAKTAPESQVIILEKADRIGKKILATGNGRCNYSNLQADPSRYYGCDPYFTEYALKEFTVDYTVNFFNNIGVFPREEQQGRLYPYSGQASSVLDALRSEISRLSVRVVTGISIKNIEKKKENFKITLKDGIVMCNNLIIACGGCASPKLGSDGSGFKLLKTLGHNIIPASPALVRLKTRPEQIKGLSGVRVPCTASLSDRNQIIDVQKGEVQFTDNGLSGIVIFDLSLKCKENMTISLDLMDEYPLKNVYEILEHRKNMLSHLTMEDFFNGLLNKRIGNNIARRCGIEKLSFKVSELDKDRLWLMARLIKDMEFRITEKDGFENAQATMGGADTREFDPKTMESKLVKNLYCCGEILDIVGSCGGYNLQWAWSSGFLAGRSAAEGK